MSDATDWAGNALLIGKLWPKAGIDAAELDLWKRQLQPLDQIVLRAAIEKVKSLYASDTPKLPWLLKEYESARAIQNATDPHIEHALRREQQFKEREKYHADLVAMRDRLTAMPDHERDEWRKRIIEGDDGRLHQMIPANIENDAREWSRGMVYAVIELMEGGAA